jgi:hypothetical protein
MKNLNPVDNYLHGSWEALGNGAPMLVALAQLCCERWVHGSPHPQVELEQLSGEARAILFAARDRGIIEIKAVNTAFDAAARILAVYVELDDEHTIAFRDPKNPEVTIQFLDGFRELCEHGMVLHHIYRDFSLAPTAITLARSIEREQVQSFLDKSTEFGIHD